MIIIQEAQIGYFYFLTECGILKKLLPITKIINPNIKVILRGQDISE